MLVTMSSFSHTLDLCHFLNPFPTISFYSVDVVLDVLSLKMELLLL